MALMWGPWARVEIGRLSNGMYNSKASRQKSCDNSLSSNTRGLATGIFTCAWHDAQAAVSDESREQNGPPFPDGRTTPTRQGHLQKWDVWRKHEADPVYVAHSEPARWCWGGGRADVTRRDLISGALT